MDFIIHLEWLTAAFSLCIHFYFISLYPYITVSTVVFFQFQILSLALFNHLNGHTGTSSHHKTNQDTWHDHIGQKNNKDWSSVAKNMVVFYIRNRYQVLAHWFFMVFWYLHNQYPLQDTCSHHKTNQHMETDLVGKKIKKFGQLRPEIWHFLR